MRKITLSIRCLVFKVALVSLISLALARLLSLSDPISVIFVSLLCIYPSFYSGLKKGIKNIGAIIIGSAVAVLFKYFIQYLYLSLPLGVVIVLILIIMLNWWRYFPLAIFAFLYLSFSKPEAIWMSGLQYFSRLVLGILAAMFVNYLISLFRYRGLYLSQLRQLFENITADFGEIERYFVSGDAAKMETLESHFRPLFRQIGNLHEDVTDLKNELRIRKKSGGLSYSAVIWLDRIIDKVEGVVHHSRDIVSFSPHLFREHILSREQKDEMNVRIKSLVERFNQIVDEIGAPVHSRKEPKKPQISSVIEHPSRPPIKVNKPVLFVSLRMSLWHLKDDVEELAKFVTIFLSEIQAYQSAGIINHVKRK